MSKIDFTSNLVVFKNDSGFITTSIDGKNREGKYVRKYVDVRFAPSAGWSEDDITDIMDGDIIHCKGFVSLSIGKDGSTYVALVITEGDYAGNVFEEKEQREKEQREKMDAAQKKVTKQRQPKKATK